ncbi:MAG: GNAT family N-acetyltransferase [Candidatus Thorarchaeota archaeon]
MSIEVRIANARDRQALKEFYSREGMDFQNLTSRITPSAGGIATETMFIIALANEMVVAAMRLDIGQDPSLGKVGFIQHFEIEDELEESDLGKQMLDRALEIGRNRNLRCLEALVHEKRKEVIKLYVDSDFREEHKEILMRKDLKTRIF